MTRVTKTQKNIAYIWNWMQRNDVPDEVKKAFKAIAMPHISDSIEETHRRWNNPGEFSRDDFAEL